MNYDQFIGSLCLWREARGVTKTAMTAIWYVIQNRASDAHNRWPKTIPGVILQRMQFSSFNLGEPNSVKFPIDNGSPDWKAWLDCCDVVTVPLGGDPTSGANHYESMQPDQTKPSWAQADKITVTISPFRFYKL